MGVIKLKENNTLISLQLPKELVAKVKENAAAMNLSMTAYIRLLLTRVCEEGNVTL